MATTKKPTSAPAKSKAPAEKVATAPETKTAEAPKDAPTEPKPGADAENSGAGNGEGLKAPADEANQAENTKIEKTESTALDEAEIQKLKDAAYKDGYAKGFEDALDGGGTTLGEDPEEGSGEDLEQIFTSGQQSYAYSLNRLGVILLAVKVPENYRKGGLTPLVDSLEEYFVGLDPDDAHAALLIANAIADKDPGDIASGRFKLLVTSALDALNGQSEASLRYSTDAEDAAAAANRLETLGMPEESEVVSDPEDPEDLDVVDPNSSESAAARLRQAL